MPFKFAGRIERRGDADFDAGPRAGITPVGEQGGGPDRAANLIIIVGVHRHLNVFKPLGTATILAR